MTSYDEQTQIRIHTKQASTTRGNTGEYSVETINGQSLTEESMAKAVANHKRLVDLVAIAMEGGGTDGII